MQREGEVETGDAIELIERYENSVTIADLVRLAQDKRDIAMMRRVIALEALPEHWREHFRKQLAKNDV